ncbi:NucA/NucB deoxyribonuclease domain-containing protein [Amycolatopsis pigmentata]|uniref:NucA/NucB deoxyribonuclease domain-containing protein n=1 Tax=Amycolatopsis pigmentata TaxID=450801 RepID=A0ABW5FVK1_9PSEU
MTQRVVQPFSLSTADNCQTVKDQIKNHKDQLKSRAVGGKHEAACVTSEPSTRKMTASGTVPAPDWCTPDEVVTTRHAACGMGTFQLHVYDIENGGEIGGMYVGRLGYMSTDPQLIDWQYEASQQFTGIWGAAEGTTVTGTGQCDGDCITSSQEWPTQVAVEDGFWEDYVVGESTTYQPGEIGSGILEATATFTNPGWLEPVVTSGATPAVRCDNMFSTSIAAGCVVPTVKPVMIYELGGPYPELARHIQEAQAKGLPGGTADQPLTRTTEKDAQDRNSKVACPTSFPKKPGEDCDEYPFASTWEGAAFGPYDAEAINSKQNQLGGNALQQFYNQERVLNHDPFVVTIV